MSDKPQPTDAEPARPADQSWQRGVARVVLFTGTVLALFFWAAGRIDWLRGWAYFGLLTLGQTPSVLYLWRKSPELIRRRFGKIGKGTKGWDKVMLAVFVSTFFVTQVVAALDARFGWSEMSPWLWPVGVALYVLFVILITAAMAVNPHFEKSVRIQEDRGHKVIDSGPYRVVRHPGYLAVIVGLILPTPLLLGSWWAMLPAVASSASLVVRTVLEDRTLREELPGYAEYAARVRYRLLPGVW